MVGVEKELRDGEVVGDGWEGDASWGCELGHDLRKSRGPRGGCALCYGGEGNGRSSVG